MADLQLATDHDLDLAAGDLILVTGVDAIAQDLDIRLNTFKGEWFLDTRIGVPYFQEILGEKPRLVALKGIFREAILLTPGVQSISDFVLSYDGPTRVLSLSFLVASIEGTFAYTKELII
jgi:hypothetical protein